METDDNIISHQELLRGKEETLLLIINPNVLLLSLLTEHDWLDERLEQAINAERTNYDRNRRLLDWLKQGPREAFDGFLSALRANGQVHVANYIDSTPGESCCICFLCVCYLLLVDDGCSVEAESFKCPTLHIDQASSRSC